MGFWRRLFGKEERETLLGGVDAINPTTLMLEVTRLSDAVEEALGKKDDRLKRQLTARVDDMIRRCEQFVGAGDFTYLPTGGGSFARVDMSKRQQLASSMLPLLAALKQKLNA